MDVPGAWDPFERYDHAMAFDAARERVVLFGGSNGVFFDGQTWEWDGARWHFRANGPYLSGVAMAYDAARGVCVLFGGWDEEWNVFGDTWEWDGVAWVQVSNSGPSPRGGCAMAYDSARSRVVLHGGWDGSNPLGDTWEWDGSEWTHVSDSGPSARFYHAMAFDLVRNVSVLVGGRGPSNSYPGQTWEWDGQSWIRKNDMMNREGMALAFDERRGCVLLFGGSMSSNRFGDAWCWDGEDWTFETADGPSPRTRAGMAYDWARSEMVLYGGLGRSFEPPFFDTWLHECGTRPRLAVTASCPKGGPVSITWRGATPNGTVALVFGRWGGRFIIPPSRPCPGTLLGLSGDVALVAQRLSDAEGSGSGEGMAGPSACGAYLQLVDLATCYAGNIARIE